MRSDPRSVNYRRRFVALVVGGCAMAQASAQLALDGHVVAGGGGRSLSPGACMVLDGTLGESASGHSAGGAYALDAGYWAQQTAVDTDHLFRSDFEVCS